MNRIDLISIIVPCYNQSIYLDECLQSVLNQTYQNWECIIVNDGSLDNTEEVALRWVEKDKRFIYLKKENGGAASARNLGIEKAKGEWIQFLDGDDLLLLDKLNLINQIDEDVNFIYSNFKMLVNKKYQEAFCNLNNNELNLSNLINLWDSGLNLPIHSPIFKKKLINNIRFKEEFKLHEDWLFWIMIFNENMIKPKFYSNNYVIYRNHSASTTKDLHKLEVNTIQVYNYAYKNILSSENKDILFYSILLKYANNRTKLSMRTNEVEKLNKSKYFKFRRYLYQITKLFK